MFVDIFSRFLLASCFNPGLLFFDAYTGEIVVKGTSDVVHDSSEFATLVQELLL